MSSNPKKGIPMLFAMKYSFKFPTLVTPNEVDRVMKDWWQMTPLQEHLKASCFYFACLTTAFLCQLHFVCFLSRKTPHHHWNNSYLNYKDFMIPNEPKRSPGVVVCKFYWEMLVPYTRAYSFVLGMYPFFILTNTFLPLARLFFLWRDFFR